MAKYNLVIASRLTVAECIAKTLGALKSAHGYYYGNGWIVSWCVKHIIDLSTPLAGNAHYRQWRKKDLPIIPNEWTYHTDPSARIQYEVLRKWFVHPDLHMVICATDASREGELTFRILYKQCGCKRPAKRLWLTSLEEDAIHDGFSNLSDIAEYENLYQAALCQSRIDWLIHVNATILFSYMYSQKLNIGRMLIPTLAIVVNREDAITNTNPLPMYRILLSGKLAGRSFTAMSEQINDLHRAKSICATCQGARAVVKRFEQTIVVEKPPHLYNLSTLQQDANRIYGYTAKETLEYAQVLYDRSLITYPCTDGQFLAKDKAMLLREVVTNIITYLPMVKGEELSFHPERVIREQSLLRHHAIIPTSCVTHEKLKDLLVDEYNVFILIAIRLICAVSDDCLFDKVTVTIECSGILFKLDENRCTQEGWRVYENSGRERLSLLNNDRTVITQLDVGQEFSDVNLNVIDTLSTTSDRYTEGTLIAAMESVGLKHVSYNNEQLSISMFQNCAHILEELVASGLLLRQGTGIAKELIPTDKGKALMKIMPEPLTSLLLAASWEQRLLDIECGNAIADDLILEITGILRQMVKTTKRIKGSTIPFNVNELGICPACRKTVVEKARGAFCSNTKCQFCIFWDHWFFANMKIVITPAMVISLLRDGYIEINTRLPDGSKIQNVHIALKVDNDGAPFFPSTRNTVIRIL